MSAPTHRLTVKDKDSKKITPIGAGWQDREGGPITIKLGSKAYGDRPEVTPRQAAACLISDRFFVDLWPNERRESPPPAPEPAGEEFGDDDIPFITNAIDYADPVTRTPDPSMGVVR